MSFRRTSALPICLTSLILAPPADRERVNLDEKIRIAAAAASRVQDGSTVILEAGRKVIVRPERYYTTEPAAIPTRVSPILKGEGFHGGRRFGDLLTVECDVNVAEVLVGYTERQGPKKVVEKYPNQYWKRDRFTRYYSSTAVLLSHSALNGAEVQSDQIVKLLLEAFLLIVPFDRAEVAASTGKHLQPQWIYRTGERFLALYDQTYGSPASRYRRSSQKGNVQCQADTRSQ